MSQPAPTPPPKDFNASAADLVPPERTFIFPREAAPKLLQASCYIKPADIAAYWTPVPGDLAGIEAGLEKFLADQSWVKKYEWADYLRQVAGMQQEAGRTLFLSYFVPELPPPPERKPAGEKAAASDTDRWKSEPYWMNDGGDTYFRVVYDPRGREFVWFERNNQP